MSRTIKARLPPFCDFHSGAIRFRMIVPKDLKECFTVTAFKISLMTANIPTARILSARLSCSLFEAFETIRQRKAAFGMKLTAEQQTNLVKMYLRQVLQRDLERRKQGDSRPVLPYGGDYTAKELEAVNDALTFSLDAEKNNEYNGLRDMLRPIVIDGAKQLYSTELKEAEHSKAKAVKNGTADKRKLKEMLAYQEITAENDEKEIDSITHLIAQGLQREVIPVMMKRASGDFTAEQQTVSIQQQGEIIDVESSPRLFECVDEAIAEKQKQGLSPSTIDNYRQTAQYIKRCFEDIPLCMLDIKAMKRARDKFREATKKLKSGTVGKLQTEIRSIFREIRKNGNKLEHGIEESFDVLQHGKTAYKDESKRAGFTSEQLAILFSAEHYKFSVTKTFQSHYWIPLIALFQGMRLTEICQLATDDIKQDENGINYINIIDNEEQHLKNTQSRRQIPIMPQLIELGFLDYVAERRKRKDERLFNMKPDKKGRYHSRFFSYLLERLDMRKNSDGDDLTFHSLRHSFATIANNSGIQQSLIKNFIGHEQGTSTLMKTYVATASVKQLYDAFKDLAFPVNIDGIKRQNWW